MRARRALLYTPGDDLHKIQKASTLDVDCICMDMEDGVALNRKAEGAPDHRPGARRPSISVAQSGWRASTRSAAGWSGHDLETVLPAHPDGIVIPKVEFAEQIQWVSQLIGKYEKTSGWKRRPAKAPVRTPGSRCWWGSRRRAASST